MKALTRGMALALLLAAPAVSAAEVSLLNVAIRLNWDDAPLRCALILEEEAARNSAKLDKELESLATKITEYLPAWRFVAAQQARESYPQVVFVLVEDRANKRRPVRLNIDLYVQPGLGKIPLFEHIDLFVTGADFERIHRRPALDQVFTKIGDEIKRVINEEMAAWDRIRMAFKIVPVAKACTPVEGHYFELPIPFEQFRWWIVSEFDLICEPTQIGLEKVFKDRIHISSRGSGPSAGGRVLIAHESVRVGAVNQKAIEFPYLSKCIRGEVWIRNFVPYKSTEPGAPPVAP